MHKPFYASGFLYHSASQQILLQQLTRDADPEYVLFGSISKNGNDPQTVFKQCVERALGVKVAASSIHAVYDYIHEHRGEQFIFYVEVTDNVPKTFSPKRKVSWLHLSKLGKSVMSEQTRHDIVVGERVIRALSEPAHTPGATTLH